MLLGFYYVPPTISLLLRCVILCHPRSQLRLVLLQRHSIAHPLKVERALPASTAGHICMSRDGQGGEEWTWYQGHVQGGPACYRRWLVRYLPPIDMTCELCPIP